MLTGEGVKEVCSKFAVIKDEGQTKERAHIPVADVNMNRDTTPLSHQLGCPPLCTLRKGRILWKRSCDGVGSLRSRCPDSISPEKVVSITRGEA